MVSLWIHSAQVCDFILRWKASIERMEEDFNLMRFDKEGTSGRERKESRMPIGTSLKG